MTTRPKKLNKSNVKSYGVFSKIDAEIFDALRRYKNICDSLFLKNRAILELKTQLIELERDEINLQRERRETLETLYDLFFRKKWHAPTLESVDNAMNAITEFRKTTAPIDDNGDIVKE